MHKVADKEKQGGEVEIFEDVAKGLFLAVPHGIINPTLLKTDLQKAKNFSKKVGQPWYYVTNTEDIKLVNPFNLLYLKEIKKLQNLKQIVIFAPGPINRLLLRIASPIVQPDRVIKDSKEFKSFLESLLKK